MSLSGDVIRKILEATPPYANASEERTCGEMVEMLTDDETMQAAMTSYAFYVASNSTNAAERPSVEVQRRMAMRMARRHLVGEGGDRNKALETMKAALVFRKDKNMDLLRTCFEVDASDSVGCSGNEAISKQVDEVLAVSFCSLIKDEFSKQTMVVRGHDRSKRAIVIKCPRVSSDTDQDAYLTAHLYIAERAIAATEMLSEGKEEKVLAVTDFADYSAANKPPFAVMRTLLRDLQLVYPETLEHLILIDPPFWMKGLFTLLSPFMNARTKEKILMVSGEEKKKRIVGPLVSNEQAMAFLLPDGKLESCVGMNHFLYSTPFHCAYQKKTA